MFIRIGKIVHGNARPECTNCQIVFEGMHDIGSIRFILDPSEIYVSRIESISIGGVHAEISLYTVPPESPKASLTFDCVLNIRKGPPGVISNLRFGHAF